MPTLDSTPRRVRRDATRNRASILIAARETIARDPRASIDAIARCAGLSRRALYGHFEDRDALIRAIVSTGAARFNDIALRIDDTDPRIALARLASLLWQEAAHVQVAASIALDDAHVDQTADALAPLRRAVLAIVRRGQEDHLLRTDVAAGTLARLVEETARVVITRMDASAAGARSLAVRAVLGIAGMSWQDARDLLTAHPGLLAPHDDDDGRGDAEGGE